MQNARRRMRTKRATADPSFLRRRAEAPRTDKPSRFVHLPLIITRFARFCNTIFQQSQIEQKHPFIFVYNYQKNIIFPKKLFKTLANLY